MASSQELVVALVIVVGIFLGSLVVIVDSIKVNINKVVLPLPLLDLVPAYSASSLQPRPWDLVFPPCLPIFPAPLHAPTSFLPGSDPPFLFPRSTNPR
jgi:hypothetical protein